MADGEGAAHVAATVVGAEPDLRRRRAMARQHEGVDGALAGPTDGAG
jgi:hypothetical protein